PQCRARTRGPSSATSTGDVSIGEAAHLCAASPGGPRYDPAQSDSARTSVENGIWLCSNCADRVDKEWRDYPATTFHEWKSRHDEWLRNEIGRAQGIPAAELISPLLHVTEARIARDGKREFLFGHEPYLDSLTIAVALQNIGGSPANLVQ